MVSEIWNILFCQDPKEKLKSAVLKYVKQQQEIQGLSLLERNDFNHQTDTSYPEGLMIKSYTNEMEDNGYFIDNMQGRNYLKHFLGRKRADFSSPVQDFISGNYKFS